MKTLSPEQISRAQRAADQRNDYTCRSLDIAGCPCVEVRKVKDGATYLVQFSTGLPACSCIDNQRHPEYICKHGVLGLAHRRDEQRQARTRLALESAEFDRIRRERELLWG